MDFLENSRFRSFLAAADELDYELLIYQTFACTAMKVKQRAKSFSLRELRLRDFALR